MEARPDPRVSVHVAENYMHIRVRERLDGADATAFLKAMLDAAARLRPGFTIVNDVREAKTVSELVAEQFGATQAALVERGCRRVIRIVGEGNATVVMQLGRKQREGKVGFEVVVVASETEAMRLVREKP